MFLATVRPKERSKFLYILNNYNWKPLRKSLYVKDFVQSVKNICNKFPTNIICTKLLVTNANKTVENTVPSNTQIHETAFALYYTFSQNAVIYIYSFKLMSIKTKLQNTLGRDKHFLALDAALEEKVAAWDCVFLQIKTVHLKLVRYSLLCRKL